jgi:hypothetical protein
VAEQQPVNGHQQQVPTVMPDPPQAQPVREPVAVPVPREVRESGWDHSGSNGAAPQSPTEERRPATVSPDGSSWS